MAETTIEWTARPRADGTMAPGYTFNMWRGCTKVSSGCKFCYADQLSQRNPGVLGVWGPRGTRVVASESYWRQPLRWNAEAAAAGERRAVFCASMADVFEGPETMPAAAHDAVEQARWRLYDLILETPHLDWLLLTKRPQHALAMLPDRWVNQEMPPNVWVGTSVEDQAAADDRIPHLLKVPARVRFLSCEPLLGPVDLTFLMRHKDERCDYCESLLAGEAGRCFCGVSHEPLIHWVITGGESGPQARPYELAWVRSLRDQCQAAGVAYFHKQWGEWVPASQAPAGTAAPPIGPRSKRRTEALAEVLGPPDPDRTLWRVGKGAAGRLLDGRTWDEIPAPGR